MFGLGGQELLLIVIFAVLLFGGTQIPRIMRGLGQGIREFKTAVKDEPGNAAGDKTPNESPKEESSDKEGE